MNVARFCGNSFQAGRKFLFVEIVHFMLHVPRKG